MRPLQQGAVGLHAPPWPPHGGRVFGSTQRFETHDNPVQQLPEPAPQVSPAAAHDTSISHRPPTQRSEQHSEFAPQLSPPNLHEKSSTQRPWSHNAGKQQSVVLVHGELGPTQKRPSSVSTRQVPPKQV